MPKYNNLEKSTHELPELKSKNVQIEIHEAAALDSVNISNDGLQVIFSFLNSIDLFDVGIVNKRFLKISKLSALWNEMKQAPDLYIDPKDEAARFKDFSHISRNAYGKMRFEWHEKMREEERARKRKQKLERRRRRIRYLYIPNALLMLIPFIVYDVTSNLLYSCGAMLACSFFSGVAFAAQSMYQFSNFPFNYNQPDFESYRRMIAIDAFFGTLFLFICSLHFMLVICSILALVTLGGALQITWTEVSIPIHILYGLCILIYYMYCAIGASKYIAHYVPEIIVMQFFPFVGSFLIVQTILVTEQLSGHSNYPWGFTLVPLYALQLIAIALKYHPFTLFTYFVPVCSSVADRSETCSEILIQLGVMFYSFLGASFSPFFLMHVSGMFTFPVTFLAFIFMFCTIPQLIDVYTWAITIILFANYVH